MLRVMSDVSDWEFHFKDEIIEEKCVYNEMINAHCDGRISIIIKTQIYNSELINKLESNEIVDIVRKIKVMINDNGNTTSEIEEFNYPNFILKNVIVKNQSREFGEVIIKLLNY